MTARVTFGCVPDPDRCGAPGEQAYSLEACRLTKAYRLPVIEDLSLRVSSGEFVCLLGPNGCGKTTLLRILAGLEVPDDGFVRYGAPRAPLGMVFQEPRLLPWLTVRDNVTLCLKPLGIRGHAARERVGRYLRLVGLHDFAHYYPGRLSGGMRQRAALARALAAEPAILLMDESFGALDPETRRVMQNELLTIRAELGTTILFVTHSVDEAVRLGTRILLLSARPARVCGDWHGEAGRVDRPHLLALLAEQARRQRDLWAREVGDA